MSLKEQLLQQVRKGLQRNGNFKTFSEPTLSDSSEQRRFLSLDSFFLVGLNPLD